MQHDFKNMTQVQKRIDNDKRITLIVSVIGLLVVASAFVFSITVLFNSID
jgi:hypothetical protein